MAGKLEVEGKEILIKSSNGIMAVIPKDKVSMVKGYINSGNHQMVDKFVNSLAEFKHDNQKAGDGLYANIHAKRQRIAAGSGERMRKPGEAGAPTAAQFKQAAKTAKAEDGVKIVPPVVNKNIDLNRLYAKYPGLKKLGETTIKADTNFNRKNTGAGSIEYFSPTQDTVTYGNNFKAAHPKLGTHGILYNPKDNNEQSIMLDMLHGMKDASPEYAKSREQLKQSLIKNFKGDIDGEWNEMSNEDKQDGKESFIDNWTDGVIRNLMFEGTPEDFKNAKYFESVKEAYLRDPKARDAFGQLKRQIVGQGLSANTKQVTNPAFKRDLKNTTIVRPDATAIKPPQVRPITPVRKDMIRPNGTMKDVGFLGVLKSPSGKDVTEYSVGVPIMGKEMDIPTLVPGLSKEEIAYVLQKADKDLPIGKDAMGNAIVQKAYQHATQRIKKGMSPFYSSVIDRAVPKMPVDNTRVNMQVPVMAKQPMSAMTQKAGDGKKIAPLVKKPTPTPSGPTKKVLVAPNPNRATTQDSLDVFNQQNLVDNFYVNEKKYDLENQKPYKGDIGKDLDKDYKNFLTKKDIIIPTPKGKSPGTQVDAKDIKDKYRKIKNNNQLYQMESSSGVLNTEAPVPLYDKRIQPQFEKKYKNRNTDQGLMSLDTVELKSYDPIAVKPWSESSEEEKELKHRDYPDSVPPSYKPKPKLVEKPEPTPETKPTPDVEEKPTVENKPTGEEKPTGETTPAEKTPAEKTAPKKGPKFMKPRRQGGWSKQPLLMRLLPRLYKN